MKIYFSFIGMVFFLLLLVACGNSKSEYDYEETAVKIDLDHVDKGTAVEIDLDDVDEYIDTVITLVDEESYRDTFEKVMIERGVSAEKIIKDDVKIERSNAEIEVYLNEGVIAASFFQKNEDNPLAKGKFMHLPRVYEYFKWDGEEFFQLDREQAEVEFEYVDPRYKES